MAQIPYTMLGKTDRSAPMFKPDFSAIILCGPGEELHPLSEGRNLPKPMLPIGSEPMIAGPLKWCETGGIRDILILSPLSFAATLQSYLLYNTDYLSSNIHITHETVKDEDALDWDTADYLRMDRVMSWAKSRASSVVILPCDLFCPASISLSKILDKHRTSKAGTLATCLFFQHPELPGKNKPGKQVIAYDKESSTLLMMANMDDLNNSDLHTRPSLHWSYPRLEISTSYLDAHVYVLGAGVLNIIQSRPEIASLRMDLLPWLCKWGYQSGISKKWASFLDGNQPKSMSESIATLANDSFSEDGPGSEADDDIIENKKWRVGLMLCKQDQGFIARANNLSSFLELNLRSLPPRSGPPIVSRDVLIDAKAQILSDTIMSSNIKIGERTNVKRSVIGRNVVIGKHAKITGCVIMDQVIIKDGAILDSCILCKNVVIGERAKLINCEVAYGHEVAEGTALKEENIGSSNDDVF